MPELPEVETIVLGLKQKVLKRTFVDAWTDFKKIIKKPKNFEEFKKELKGKKIEDIKRRAKNILFYLSSDKVLLIHQKLTGHLLLGKWQKENERWRSLFPGPLSDDPMNKFLHLIFFLDDGNQIALSDVRKFAKVELWQKEELKKSKDFKNLGPEPLKKDFTLGKFKKILLKKKGKIKQVLMDQTVIAGIGNIYSDEALWWARVNPQKEIKNLSQKELKDIYQAIKKVLKKGIEFQGESISDFRKVDGTRGDFDRWRKVYRKEKQKCQRCGEIIQRKKMGGRSAHYCPNCQKL